MKKFKNRMFVRHLLVVALLAGWVREVTGQDAHDNDEPLSLEVQLISTDESRDVPATVQAFPDFPNWKFRFDIGIRFFSKDHMAGGEHRGLLVEAYRDGIARCLLTLPYDTMEESGFKREDVTETRISLRLNPSKPIPWHGEVSTTLDRIVAAKGRIEMPVQYNRSVAEGHPSVKVAFQLLSGVTGEPVAGYRIDASSPAWHVRSQQGVWTDEQGAFHLNVYGDEDHLMLHGGQLGPRQPDRMREAKVRGDLVRKHIESATPLVLKGETPRIRGRIEIDDPEQKKLMETLKGNLNLEYIERPEFRVPDVVVIEKGRFNVYAENEFLDNYVKTGMKSRIRGFGGDFKAYVLAKPVEFNLPEKGANEELVVRVVAPTTVDALIRVQASRDGRPVEGAVVILERRGEKPIRLTAGPNGEVSARVPVGEYSLSASAPGFADKSQEGARILGADALEIRLRKLVDFEVAAEGPGSEELAMVMAVSLESDAERSASFPEGQSRATVRRVPEGKAMIMLADRKGRVAGVKSIEVEEGKSERIVLREPVPLNLRVEADKKRLDHMSVMLLDKQTRCPMHPAHLAGKPLATMLPPGVYEVFAILPPGLLPPNPESEEPGAFPFMTQTWVLLGEADLSKASAKEEVELVLEFPKHFKPLLRSDVLHPAFR